MRLPIRYRAYNSGGKGGQHSNRTYNAIEATVELPDGRVIRARSEMKSQHRSKKVARALLLGRVREALAPETERGATAGWGNSARRVRTYHEPDDRVTDEAGFQASYKQTVGRDDLRSLIEERRSRKAAL